MKKTIILLIVLIGLAGIAVWRFNLLEEPAVQSGLDRIREFASKMPRRGICVRGGAAEAQPRNTLPAFREAIAAGVHMIRLPVFLTADQVPVVVEGPTLDRTTNGSGTVSRFTLDQIRQLDAGVRRGNEFAGTRIPSLEEVFNIAPVNLWLLIDVPDLETARRILAEARENGRLDQTILLAPVKLYDTVTALDSALIVALDLQSSAVGQMQTAVTYAPPFVQIPRPAPEGLAEHIAGLHENGSKAIFSGSDSPTEIMELFEAGVDFIVVNKIPVPMEAARRAGIEPLDPQFREAEKQ